MTERMRVALGQFNEMTHERLTFAYRYTELSLFIPDD